MTKRVFVNYYFRTKYGQGARAASYFEEIKTQALTLGIVDVRMGLVEIGDYSPSTCFSLTFESGDALGRQWGNGSEYAAKNEGWAALWNRVTSEPSEIFERVGSQLIYER